MTVKRGATKLFEIEKEIEKYWRENKIIDKVLKKEGKHKFYFLDGPPYVTEKIHVGTAWNKLIKDAILRFKRMCGYSVWSMPGYDTHGLPIEVMVEKQLKITNKKEITKIGVELFNNKCLEMVKRNMHIITDQFKKLAVWMDWENPYATYTTDYISNIWWVIKKAYEQDLLEEDLRVFHWCPRCETVLSEHEVSMGYREVKGPSIYVKFPLREGKNTYLLVWTTTPWTLPSNVAIAVHPDFTYIKVKLKKTGEELILYEGRVNDVILEEYELIDKYYGSELEGKEYISPLLDLVDAQQDIKAHFIVLSREYVRHDEGTGLVHIAPEHGKEDFEIKKKYNLPIISIVGEDGRFLKKAGKYMGLYIFDADSIIIDDLRRKKYLYKEEEIVHRYPHCWRCRTPLLMKTTKQWILKLSYLKDKLLEENEKILWIPEWAGKHRFKSWLETARDWVITRQRYWGTPAPIWKCEKCGETQVIGGIEEIIEKGYKTADLHRPYIDLITWNCEKCGGLMKRIPDVLDVWIDSGAASWAALGYPKRDDIFKRLWPVDFIVEGHDQTRGWFYSLLCLGMIAFNRAPYNTVLVHGFTLDESGIGMSKSLGNVIYPEEFTESYGVDAFRVAMLTHTIWDDMIVSFKRAEEAVRQLNILLNIYEFYDIYASIDNYKWPGVIKQGLLQEEDKWIISKFENLIKKVTDNMEKYHIHSAIKEILNFAIEDLSRKYIKIIRRRVWIEEESKEKISVYHTLHYILKRLALILAPFTPHISEHVYINIISKFDNNTLESVHLENWPEHAKQLISKELIERYDLIWRLITILNSLRQEAGIKIRQPLKEAVIPEKIFTMLSTRSRKILMEQANITNIIPYKSTQLYKYIKLRVRPLPDKLGPKFKNKLNKVINALSKLDQKQILDFKKNGKVKLKVDGEMIIINKEDVEFSYEPATPYYADRIGDDYVLINTLISRKLYLEGLTRDIVRRIQQMRKEINLDVMDVIEIYIKTDVQDLKDSITLKYNYILTETRGKNIIFSSPPSDVYIKTWKIDNKDITVGIKVIKL